MGLEYFCHLFCLGEVPEEQELGDRPISGVRARIETHEMQD